MAVAGSGGVGLVGVVAGPIMARERVPGPVHQVAAKLGHRVDEHTTKKAGVAAPGCLGVMGRSRPVHRHGHVFKTAPLRPTYTFDRPKTTQKDRTNSTFRSRWSGPFAQCCPRA